MGVSRRREQCCAMGPKRRARGAHVAAAASCGFHREDHRAAQLTFTLTPVEDGVCITHQISVAFRFPWAMLVPVLALVNKRALAADLDSLRRAIDEGHDLTARKRS